jgi:hypothetical protein
MKLLDENGRQTEAGQKFALTFMELIEDHVRDTLLSNPDASPQDAAYILANIIAMEIGIASAERMAGDGGDQTDVEWEQI